MKLTYIYHSGFAIESDELTILIDYFRDMPDKWVTGTLLKRPGALYVLASHAHGDHFNKRILEWKQQRPDIRYIFSRDILTAGKAREGDAVYLDKFDIYEDGQLRVQAFGSTDIGVSFLIETEGKKLFHAGDLNNWHWRDESTPEESAGYEAAFLKEVDELARNTSRLDLAMFPIDPRLGKEYMRGAQQFIDQIAVDWFVPMHFGTDYDKANAFRAYAHSKGTRFFELNREGQSMNF